MQVETVSHLLHCRVLQTEALVFTDCKANNFSVNYIN